MPHTNHGHWYGPGEPTQPGPRAVAKCGGPGICAECGREAGLKQRPGDQPLPVPNNQPDVQSMVMADITARRDVGIQRYGTALQPFNGRDALRDAYEEAMDLTIYLRQVMEEQRPNAARVLQAEATIARVKQANDDMRAWCSPYGFVVRCADHIDAALAQPDDQPTLDVSDLREQIANALLAWHAKHAIVCEHTQVIEYGGMADAVMTVLPKACSDPIECGHEAALGEAEEALAAKDAEIGATLDGLADSADRWFANCEVFRKRAEQAEERLDGQAWEDLTKRAERAEAERDRLKDENEGLTLANNTLSKVTRQGSDIPRRQHQAIEWIRTIAGGGDVLPSEWAMPWRVRAERAEATLARLEEAISIADDSDVTDWQRGYRACADRARAALAQPDDQPKGTT